MEEIKKGRGRPKKNVVSQELTTPEKLDIDFIYKFIKTENKNINNAILGASIVIVFVLFLISLIIFM